ncbi:hypothetical protein J437_LFUL002787 [Ladona fulva]|uniref:Uncharacterized protein n=1 Tax=Ladona fulva TaxID=123851 RepID=A0A8K0JSS3_LADFU|nr:hypothetical protein J437_LFUL002787 [Ladona fulva]
MDKRLGELLARVFRDRDIAFILHKRTRPRCLRALQRAILREVPPVDVEAVLGRSVQLPCDVTPPGHDKVYMVFWFRDDAGIPLYR